MQLLEDYNKIKDYTWRINCSGYAVTQTAENKKTVASSPTTDATAS